MPTASSPLRLDADLVASAGLAAPVMSRSTAQQIAHWARIGRELERSPAVSLQAVADALASSSAYDGLSAEEQSVVRAFWTERMRALRDALRVDRDFEAAGYRYAELDARGKVVERGDPRARPPRAATTKARSSSAKRGRPGRRPDRRV